eukprot:SRR837773.12384.p5 GENE.SRR837773.12384~~SRR837773.12384.p5  ORF type:complete len:114 (+),score=16.29 SRR837773.12384:376-717(+)
MWGDDTGVLGAGGQVDLLLAIDCVYDKEAVAPLLSTLERICCTPRMPGGRGAVALVAWDASYRRGSEQAHFMSSLSDYGLVSQKVSQDALRQVHRRASVSLFVISAAAPASAG